MDWSRSQVLGLLLIAFAMLAIGALVLRSQPRAIKIFAFALCVVGLGYLATTPAPTEVFEAVFRPRV